MNKKGISKGFQILLFTLLGGIIVFVLFSTSIFAYFKDVKTSFDELVSTPSTQIEDLKRTQEANKRDVESKEEREARVTYMESILVNGVGFLKAKSYDDAIEQYNLYLKECGINSHGCNIPNNIIKFSVLNSLRSKFYNMILENPINAEKEYKEIISLSSDKWPYDGVSLKDYGWNYYQTKILVLTKKGDLKGAEEILNEVDIPSWEINEIYKYEGTDFDFFFEYSEATSYYNLVKDPANNEDFCDEALVAWENIIKKSPSKLFNVIDYPFISEPYKETKELCKVS